MARRAQFPVMLTHAVMHSANRHVRGMNARGDARRSRARAHAYVHADVRGPHTTRR